MTESLRVLVVDNEPLAGTDLARFSVNTGPGALITRRILNSPIRVAV
jgi:hypothetical protein